MCLELRRLQGLVQDSANSLVSLFLCVLWVQSVYLIFIVHLIINLLSIYAGVFALLQAYAFLRFLQDHSTWSEIQQFFHVVVAGVAGLVFAVVVLLTYFGMFTFTIILVIRRKL